MTKKPKPKRKGIDVLPNDVQTIAVYALTTTNLRFKNYVEKLLRDHAETIRKKQSK